ncbi:D-alanyl-D-alanine carboxypeptidase [Paenibacillus taihuensis]|uniref:D-alanyl-D-alanine carboxypeptidase n=1 Tax=Paenibacillus taihuensis TaxID=1156355 RepID=A0A3D9R127_9BACL|nr:M15 family metallopeptidase [Paenibacillus taihuensis]REE66957.1 D-alanyl-D-alanine carboxypeptidase [Paenibacillus taihuensis]
MKKTIAISTVVLGVAAAAVILSSQTSVFDDLLGQSDHKAQVSENSSNPAAPEKSDSTNTANSTAGKGNDTAAQTDTKEVTAASATMSSSQAAFQNYLHENSPALTVMKNAEGKDIVTNENSNLVLVNKKRELDSTYIPKDLVVAKVTFSFSGTSPKQQLRAIAAEALEKLFAGAKKDGIELAAVSGYRSYVSQKSIFDNYARENGEEEANTFSAHPGQSEHQTGLAMDVSSASVHYDLDESFGESKEGKWLAEHAADYGFIIRYQKGKENLTGYTYEPWHIRYVGVAVAQQIKKDNETLEQFLAKY